MGDRHLRLPGSRANAGDPRDRHARRRGQPPLYGADDQHAQGPALNRRQSWGDLHNARDLGGLPTASGLTRFGRLYRSPRPDQLDADGWSDVAASGVTTLLDLRNDGEGSDSAFRPAGIVVVRRPIEDQADAAFMAAWGDSLGSPAYYGEALRRWPGLFADAVTAIADADGGVLIHCAAGRDRTGLVTALVLGLAGVDRDAILDDYELGVRETNNWLRLNPIPHEQAVSDDALEQRLRAARATLGALLEETDVEAYLLGAGVPAGALARIRSLLLDA